MSGCRGISENIGNACGPVGEGGHFVLLVALSAQKESANILFSLARNRESANIPFRFFYESKESANILFLVSFVESKESANILFLSQTFWKALRPF